MTDPRLIAQSDQAEGPSLADVAELCAEFGFHYDDNDSLEILHNMITAAITRWRASVAPPAAEALTHGRALLAQAEARAEDADLFRLWIHEASARPGRIAKAISSCVTPDDYREALRKLAPDYSNRAYPVDLAELHDPDFSNGLTASQHLDVVRGGPDHRVTATPAPEEPEAERVLRLAEIIREADGTLQGVALALAALADPSFSDCHDGPAALPAPDHVNLIGFAFGREPWATWLRQGGCLESAHCELSDLMLAVLAKWGRPAALPVQGEGEGLSDQEIIDLADFDAGFDRYDTKDESGNEGVAWECSNSQLLHFARLVRQGRPAALSFAKNNSTQPRGT